MVCRFYVRFLCFLFLLNVNEDGWACQRSFLLQTERTVIKCRHYAKDPSISRQGTYVCPEAITLQKVTYKRGLFFSAFKNKTEELIASVDFFEFDKQERLLEVTIAIDRRHQRQGYASEILQHLLPHVSKGLPDNLIVAQSDYVNDEESVLGAMVGVNFSPLSFLERGGMTYFGANTLGFKGYCYVPLHRSYKETLTSLNITLDSTAEFHPDRWRL